MDAMVLLENEAIHLSLEPRYGALEWYQYFSISMYLLYGLTQETIGMDSVPDWENCKSISVSVYDY